MQAELRSWRKSDVRSVPHRLLALLLCWLLVHPTLVLAQNASPEAVGTIVAVQPGATINHAPAAANARLMPPSVIRTDKTGRLRIRLRGGANLSIRGGPR